MGFTDRTHHHELPSATLPVLSLYDRGHLTAAEARRQILELYGGISHLASVTLREHRQE